MPGELEAELIAEMAAALARDRGYASYYQWPERQVMERGIVTDFLQFAHDHFPKPAAGVDSLDEDPPDVVVTFPQKRIGVEVTELVDQPFLESVVRAKRAGHPSYDWASWDAEKFARFLQARIAAKAEPKEIYGGPYDEYVLLVHTAEPGLRPADVSDWLQARPVKVDGILSRAFILFDYHPDYTTRVVEVG